MKLKKNTEAIYKFEYVNFTIYIQYTLLHGLDKKTTKNYH